MMDVRQSGSGSHRAYLTNLATVAWHDLQVTDAERADLLDVARLLAVPADEAPTIVEDSRHAPPPAAQQTEALRAGALQRAFSRRQRRAGPGAARPARRAPR
jgi:hypothetical protein